MHFSDQKHLIFIKASTWLCTATTRPNVQWERLIVMKWTLVELVTNTFIFHPNKKLTARVSLLWEFVKTGLNLEPDFQKIAR